MNRIRTQTKAQIEASQIDFAAFSADLARYFPTRTPKQIARLASITATVAMIESDTLTMYLMDAVAITLQAESAVQHFSED